MFFSLALISYRKIKYRIQQKNILLITCFQGRNGYLRHHGCQCNAYGMGIGRNTGLNRLLAEVVGERFLE